MPPSSVNQTCDSVAVAVPTASLLPAVHVGIAPGAPGTFCAELCAVNPNPSTAIASNHLLGSKDVTSPKDFKFKKGEEAKLLSASLPGCSGLESEMQGQFDLQRT